MDSEIVIWGLTCLTDFDKRVLSPPAPVFSQSPLYMSFSWAPAPPPKKFLVTTDKNIFAYKPFMALNISDFSLLFM